MAHAHAVDARTPAAAIERAVPLVASFAPEARQAVACAVVAVPLPGARIRARAQAAIMPVPPRLAHARVIFARAMPTAPVRA